MPYRRGLMISGAQADATAAFNQRRSLPLIEIPCLKCKAPATLLYREGFRCRNGHEFRSSEPKFACLKSGCKRQAHLTLRQELDCGRHRNPWRPER